MEKGYYTAKEAVPLLGLSESTIKRKCREGLIPHARYSKKYLIPVYFIKKAFSEEEND